MGSTCATRLVAKHSLINKIVTILFSAGLPVAVLGVCFNSVFASTSNGTIDSNNKYAWGENLGWINFAPSNGNVTVTDTALSGYIWSDQAGWIHLNPETAGVKNNCSGQLSGFAWGENVGWINFSGVTINSVGKLTGTAGTASTTPGRISFDCTNCNVQTDWRPCSVRNANTGGGGSGGGGNGPPLGSLSAAATSSATSVGATSSAISAAAAMTSVGSTSATSTSQKFFSSAVNRCPYFLKSLRRGMSDPEVKLMQSFLMYYGFMASDTPTNYFGQKSQAAVRQFQEAHAATILEPWGMTHGSGWWYITTRKQANEMVSCVTTGKLIVSLLSGDSLNVRTRPSTTSPILHIIRNGETFDYYDQSEGWYYIDYAPGESGWVSGAYVRVVAKSALEQ